MVYPDENLYICFMEVYIRKDSWGKVSTFFRLIQVYAVDRRNPKEPPDMYEALQTMGYLPYQTG